MPIPPMSSAVTRLREQAPTQALAWTGSATLIVVGALTIGPFGTSGQGLAVALLLPLNCLVLLARHLPATAIRPDAAFAGLLLGAAAADALIAVDAQGTAYLFAYFLAGQAGGRLAVRPATVVAVVCGGLCAGVLALDLGPGWRDLPWPIGLTVGLPVLIGMGSRIRRQATESAIDAARSAERAAVAEARSAVLTERARIARDVHDVLAHSLGGINMQLELADALLETGDLNRVREANDKAHSLVRESLQQAQRTVHALREDALPLLESLSATLESSGQHDALTVIGTDREVPATVSQNLLRIAQEALPNAARHAPGGAVRVELEYRPGDVELRITNRPATRTVTVSPGSGMGLIGMRERVALLRGTLTAGPVTDGQDAGGWRVTAVIPE